MIWKSRKRNLCAAKVATPPVNPRPRRPSRARTVSGRRRPSSAPASSALRRLPPLLSARSRGPPRRRGRGRGRSRSRRRGRSALVVQRRIDRTCGTSDNQNDQHDRPRSNDACVLKHRDIGTHFRRTRTSRPNWKKFRRTSKNVSNTSSPLAEHPLKKMTTRVTAQKAVMARSRAFQYLRKVVKFSRSA